MVMNSTEDEIAQQLELGITSNTVTSYHYKQHKYQTLKDAVSYARIDQKRVNPDPEPPAGAGVPNE